MRHLFGLTVFLLLITCLPSGLAFAAPVTGVPEPQPTPDRLAIPVLPENPTQVDVGNSVYYYNCMPCHGDQCQGLTEEFREIWVEDHQNCWASGCHGGRERDEGFPIPRQISDVLGLEQFQQPEDLYNYLHITHPPQRPGALTEEEYWAATAFLLFKSGRITAEDTVPAKKQVSSIDNQTGNFDLRGLLLVSFLIPIISWLIIRQTRQVEQEK